MKSFIKLTGLLLLLSLLGSCNNLGNNQSAGWSSNPKETLEDQIYTIEDYGLSIIWTAYKFTDKIGVSGTFENHTIYKDDSPGSIENILNRLQLSIITESIATDNAIRDFKIRTYFFKVFNTPTITGTVINAKDGEGFIKLRMNNMSRNTPFTYSLENDTILLFTHLNLKKWKAEEALVKLNEECYELHKGIDGISKLWPNVDVVVRLPVDRTVL